MFTKERCLELAKKWTDIAALKEAKGQTTLSERALERAVAWEEISQLPNPEWAAIRYETGLPWKTPAR